MPPQDLNPFHYLADNRTDVWNDFLVHSTITLKTLVIAMAIALILGTIVSRFPFLYTPVLGIFGLIYTVPSLAMLAFLVPIVGTGEEPALIALVLYAQFILVRNVVVGLRSVDRAVIDAARGMGMNRAQILLKIEYPLALPVILGGLRVATVATIAIATIAAWIDAGGLGTLLFDGIKSDTENEIILGAICVSLLAVVADIILRLVDRMLPATRARAGRS
jgi:osmoprotectant transport system permease protein